MTGRRPSSAGLPRSAAGTVVASIGFAVLTVSTAFGLIFGIEFLGIATHDAAGGVMIVLVTGVFLALLVCWVLALRALIGRVRSGAGTIASLTPAEVRAVTRVSGIDRHLAPTTTKRGPVAPIKRLATIERAIGDALRQLDQAPDRGGLTKAQLADIRSTGLRASAWLSAHARRVDPAILSDQQIADGIGGYAALARAAAHLVAGRTDPAAVRAAREHLDALIGPGS